MDELVERLTNDLKPLKRLPSATLGFGAWLVAALIYGGLVVSLFAVPRGDLFGLLSQTNVVFEVTLMAMVGLSAGFASFRLTRPDVPLRHGLVVTPLVVLGVFILWKGVTVVSGQEHLHVPLWKWYHCTNSGLVFVVGPAIFLTYLTARRGATTHPNWLLAMNSLAVCGLGYVGVRLTCGLDDLMHDLIYHTVPFVFSGMLMAMLAKRFFRW